MTPELGRCLLTLGLTRRDFAAIVGIHEDVVCAWGKKKRDKLGGIRPEPLWARHLVHAWLADRSLLKDAVIVAQLQTERAMNVGATPG